MRKDREQLPASDSKTEGLAGYSMATQLTMNSIEARSAGFKHLVIGYAFVGVGALLLTIFGGFIGLLGLIFLPILLVFFLFSDHRMVNRWRAAILSSWMRREVDLGLLEETLSSIPGIPQKTLQGQLESLPALASRDGSIPSEMRKALSLTQTAIGEVQVQHLAANMATYAAAALIVVMATILGNFAILLALIAAIFLARMLEMILTARRFRKHCELVDRLCSEAAIDPASYSELARALDWSSISEKDKGLLIGKYTAPGGDGA